MYTDFKREKWNQGDLVKDGGVAQVVKTRLAAQGPEFKGQDRPPPQKKSHRDQLRDSCGWNLGW
jgi:hypothetical protein